MLTIKNIKKDFKKENALSDFSLSIIQPEIIGLFGHNGAGKSTLLKILGGIIKETGGTWQLDDVSLHHHDKAYLSRIGYMPDDFTFPSYLTIFEALSYYGKLRKCTKSEILTTLELVGLADIKHNRTTKLSKGMKQRLLFAQAIIGKPKLLLLDEPTNGLDSNWTSQLKKIILKLHEDGATILISSHQHDFLNEICHRRIYLVEGKIQEIIPPISTLSRNKAREETIQ